MRKPGNGRDQILKKVEQAFSKHRRRNHGRASYSESLRALALSAVEMGATREKVAEAAGISQASLTNWQKCRPTEKPQELRLLVSPMSSGSGRNNEISEFENLLARIKLSSGVSIELPIAALTSSLIATLNGGAQ